MTSEQEQQLYVDSLKRGFAEQFAQCANAVCELAAQNQVLRAKIAELQPPQQTVEPAIDPVPAENLT